MAIFLLLLVACLGNDFTIRDDSAEISTPKAANSPGSEQPWVITRESPTSLKGLRPKIGLQKHKARHSPVGVVGRLVRRFPSVFWFLVGDQFPPVAVTDPYLAGRPVPPRPQTAGGGYPRHHPMSSSHPSNVYWRSPTSCAWRQARSSRFIDRSPRSGKVVPRWWSVVP